MTDADGRRSRLFGRVQVLPDHGAPWRPTWPFVLIAAGAFPLAILPLDASFNPNLVVLAAVFFVIAATLTLLPGSDSLQPPAVPGERSPWWIRPLTTQVPVLFWCLTVAALQASGGGADAGYAPLLILPVVAQAVYGLRRDLFASLALTTLTLLVPVFVWGAPRYPRSEIRGAVLWLISAAGAGLVIEQLVRAGREKQRSVVAVARLGRELDEATELGRALAKGATRITGADIALLHEPSGDGTLQLCGWNLAAPEPHPVGDTVLPRGADPFAPPDRIDGSSGPARVLDETGEPVLLREVDPAEGPFDQWLHDRQITSVLHVLATRHWRRHVVLTLGWRRISIAAVHELSAIAELLANEAVVALDRAQIVSGLENAAAHDPLTGLPNRRAWDKHLTTEVSRARRSHEPLAVVLLDLDRFKLFNDTNGHVAGDVLLHDAAEAWQSELRPGDLLARWGGEEFGLLLTNTEVEQAVEIVERLRSATPGGQTVSAGLAMFDRDADATSLTDAADRALYAAKQAGRNRLALARSEGPRWGPGG